MSADDLADGFILDKDDRRLLSYKVRLKISDFSEVWREYWEKQLASELCGDIESNLLLRAGSTMKSPVFSDPVCWKISKNGGYSERWALTALTVKRIF